MHHRSEALKIVMAWVSASICALIAVRDTRADDLTETFRYVKHDGSRYVIESEIRIRSWPDGVMITSVTHRGDQTLEIASRFNSDHMLQEVKVTIQRGKHQQIAIASINNGLARVVRKAKQPKELPAPPNVIVTSAPDWTDSFMAVRRYGSGGDIRQEFAGLWIHPTQEPLKLRIKLTKKGSDTVNFDGKQVNLDRYLLELRGGSRYTVWSNSQQQLVRLVPEKSAKGGIFLSGWEEATSGLKPGA